MEVQYLMVGLNALNSVILALLLYIFCRNYRHLKTKYNIGLIIFASLFLLDNVLAGYMKLSYWPVYSEDAVYLVLFRRVIELIGLSSLLCIKWR